jgi:hypothetical protein
VAIPNSQSHASFGFGAFDSDGNQWANHFRSVDNQSTSNTQRGQRTDSAYYTFDSGGNVEFRASYSSMDSDGFTLNFATAQTSRQHVASLALSGLDLNVGEFIKSTGGAPAAQSVTGVGFEPDGLFLSGIQAAASTTFAVHSRFGMGMTDGMSEFSTAGQDADALGTTSTDKVNRITKTYAKMDNDTPSVDAEADLTSFDSDGFTLKRLYSELDNERFCCYRGPVLCHRG